MTKTLVAVRDVDEETFRKFRALSIEERMKLGDALTGAMSEWIKEKKAAAKTKPDPKNLMKLSGIIKTDKPVRWSEEVDEFLYGLKK